VSPTAHRRNRTFRNRRVSAPIGSRNRVSIWSENKWSCWRSMARRRVAELSARTICAFSGELSHAVGRPLSLGWGRESATAVSRCREARELAMNRSEWSRETKTDDTNGGYRRTPVTAINATRTVFSAATTDASASSQRRGATRRRGRRTVSGRRCR